MLMFNGVHGVHHEFLTVDMAREFAKKILAQTPGIEIATTMPSGGT